jgi:RNA polymerase sigma factor (sigma-70 family)
VAPFLASRTERSFERIYQQHVGDVYRYALAVLRNASDAEDVTQTTFLNAYRVYRAGERPRTPHNWLIAIAHNVCRQRFRQSQRRVEEVAYDETVAEAFAPDDDAPTADDIRRAMSHLAFNQRAALVMRELEGRSYNEIAEILDLSVSAVETLIFRARRALREQLEGGLTCREAELAVSRQLDGRLERAERGPLRAHLRECEECATLARKLRAQRSAIRALGLIPVPPSLATFFGGAAAGGTAAGIGSAVVAKAVAGVAAGLLVAGGGYEVARNAPWTEERQAAVPAAAVVPAQRPAATADAATRAATTRAASPAPLALAPGERDAAAPFGPAIGLRGVVPPGQARSAEAKAEAAERKAERATSAKPAKAVGTRSARAEERAARAKAKPATRRPAKAQPATRRPVKAKPQRAPKRRARPDVRHQEPAAATPDVPAPRPERTPPGRDEVSVPAVPVDPVDPVVEDVIETVTEPVKKLKK